METPVLYRKRLIPDECILLKDDLVLHCDDDLIVTKWNVLKTRKDLSHGYSAYFLKEGFKISKFYRADNILLYWYCDIVEYSHDVEKNSLTSTDLLVDVVVYPDGAVRVLDLDELALAMEKQILTPEQTRNALVLTDRLLNLIYSHNFDTYRDKMEQYL